MNIAKNAVILTCALWLSGLDPLAYVTIAMIFSTVILSQHTR